MDEGFPFTAVLCQGSPGADDVAELITAGGGAVRWCSPDCTHGSDEDGES